jgi:hypothetical protein
MPQETPAPIELRLSPQSPGPAELGKQAQEIRWLLGMGVPGDNLMRRQQRDRNQGDRLPVDLRADFDTARVEARNLSSV